MRNIIFLTDAYPYFPGEQFIESEITAWARQGAVATIVAPLTARGRARTLPPGVQVDLALTGRITLLEKLGSAAASITSVIFWKEVYYLASSRRSRFWCYAEAFRTTARVRLVAARLKGLVERHNADCVYCYWNDIQAYAAVLLKRRGYLRKIFSRLHRFDLYEHQRRASYMPLKRQLIGEMDLLIAISEEGRTYLQKTYFAGSDCIVIARLGVPIPARLANHSPAGMLHVVSVSFCTAVKRIDKLIEALGRLKDLLGPVEIYWTHIGDGPLAGGLIAQAAASLSPKNIHWTFAGTKSNEDVRRFYETNLVDVFVNVSESEGVPVSIMEAMSYGVPAIAPNVGGVAELVSGDAGVLMSENPSVDEISNAIARIYADCRRPSMRCAARRKVVDEYDASTNYKSLVATLTNSCNE